jgi:hypothetical protein
MAKMITITGMPQVLVKMRRATKKLGKKFQRGASKAALFLERKATEVVPVDLDTLRPGVATRNVGGSGFKADVIVTYGPNEYAVYVHEDMNAKHKPGKTAKFLEQPALDNKNELFKIVAKG